MNQYSIDQQQTLEAIQRQHEELLLQNDEIDEIDIKRVQTFLKTIAQAGSYIENPPERSLLRNLIRYWSGIINDKTGKFPVVQLQPFDGTQAVGRTVLGGGSLCQRCGTQNALAAHFCVNCGNSLLSAGGPPVQTTQPIPSSPPEQQPPPKRRRQRQSPSPEQQPTPTPSPPAVVPSGGSLCQRCGTQNALTAHFCMNCGNSLPSASGLPQQSQSSAWENFRKSVFYPLLVAILTLAFTLGVQWFLGPQDESTIIQLMNQEAQIATTHTGSLANIYDAQATLIDAGCQTPGQGVVWSGLAQITDRYNHLGQFTSLEHADPHISWEPNNRWATKAYVSATTIGEMASGPIHGNELWTFAKINGRWLITSFTNNFCQP